MNRFFAALVLLLMSASMLMSQQSTGTILGVVKDSSGGAVPDAKVTVTNTSTNIPRTTNSGGDGSYRFDALTPGPYTVTVTKDGFETSTVTSLMLEVAQQLVANVTVQVGSVSQQVTVEAEAAQVNTTQSALGGLVTTEQVADLPLNGRNFIDLALLQPGVTNATANGPALFSATYFSTNGAPVRANLITLDGAPMMNVQGSTSDAVGTTLGVDGIQEFRVITNSFGAQYGIAMGSQIVMVSKGGTNQFHGDVFDYLRNDDLDAWGFFALAQPKLIRNNFGGSFGGPIKKDNTFFYAVYEGIRQTQGSTNTINTLPANCHVFVANPCATNPTIPATYNTGTVIPVMQALINLYPLPNVVGTTQYTHNNNLPESVNYGQIRVDHTFSAKDSMFGRYTIDKSSLLTAVSFEGTPYQGVGTQSVGSSQFASLGENHIFSPTLLNSFRISYSRTLNQNNAAYPASFADPQYKLVYNQPFGTLTDSQLSSTALGAGSTSPQGFNQNLYSLSDDVYWTKGRHAFQFGTLFNRIEYYVYNSQFVRGGITFTTTANMMSGNYQTVNDQQPGSNINREPRFYTMGFYAQDDWRFSSRLTLNLGLRYEPQTTLWDRGGANWAFQNLTDPAPTNDRTFQNKSFRNFEPRLGFAWDIRGNGKTAIRAGFGVYDDVNAGGQAVYGASAGTPPLSSMLALTNGTVSSFPIITPANNLVPGSMPYGQAIKTTGYRDEQPQLYQWNLSIQQQITPSISVTAAYVGTRGVHLWDYEEGNPCLPKSVVNGIPNWGTDTGNFAPFLLNGVTTSGVSHICNTVLPGGLPLIATYPNGIQYVVPTSRNPLWGDWVLSMTNGVSKYHGGQLTITKRASHGLEAQAAYTFSKVLDEAQGEYSFSECRGSGGLPESSLEPIRHNFDYGPSCFDVTQVVQASFLYHFPKTNIGGFVGRKILTGWWVGNKTAWQTGFPFSPTSNNWRSLDQNVSQNGGTNSEYINYGVATVAPLATGPDAGSVTGTSTNTTGVTFIPYDPKTVITGTAKQWFNPLMFTLNPIGQLGTVHRNVLRGPHLSNVDLSLNKDTALPLFGEDRQLQFRVEVFNLFNKTNLAMPSGYHIFTGALTHTGDYSEAPVNTAGQINAISSSARQIQLSLKIIF